MLTILLHSSKTMREPGSHNEPYQEPAHIAQAETLAGYLKSLPLTDLAACMKLSQSKAEQTHNLITAWTTDRMAQRPAIDAFLGDIYSGLQVQSFSVSDRAYANQCLVILSGLYGYLKALDSIYPYRLEMGYKLPDGPFRSLYSFWGDRIATTLPAERDIINLSAVEYTKAVLPYCKDRLVITPKFLTVSPKTGLPTFVTVHAKVARGAFARYLIQNRITSSHDLTGFNDLGYKHEPMLSSPTEPVFVCQQFDGLGLSVRLT